MTKRAKELEALGARAARQILHLRWLRILDATAQPLFGALAVILIGVHLLELLPSGEPIRISIMDSGYELIVTWLAMAGFGVVLAWLIGTFAYSRMNPPTPLEALAHWDERAGRNELLCSAYSFELEGQTGPAVELHLQGADAVIPEAKERLERDLPSFVTNPSWTAPVMFLFLVSGLLLTTSAAAAPEASLSEAEQARAAAAGQSLEERAKELGAKALTEEEAKRLDELKKKMKETADKLKNPRQGTKPRDLLEELEKRAREAEKMAKAIGTRKEKISGGLLAELGRHADTAELAAALRGNDLAGASKQARNLGDKLSGADLSNEARTRIQEAFTAGLKAATQQDKLTALGKHLTAAQAKLLEKDAKSAGGELHKLADAYQKLAERLKAHKRLKELAKRLRTVGQEMLGKQQEGARKLNQLPPAEGLKRITGESDIEPGHELPPMDGPPPEPQPEDDLQNLVPLDEPPGPGAPVPGQGGPPPMPGGGQQPGGQRGPIPGQGPPGGFRPGGGQQPGGVPGGMPGGMPGGQGGGQQPGNGQGPGAGEATETMESTSTEVVGGRRGRGPSQVKRRAGRDHRESASEDTKAMAAEFLKAEEDALADEPLPAVRREQVLKYFRAIRRQLEASEKKKQD